MILAGAIILVCLLAAAAGLLWHVRRRSMDRWLPTYIADRSKRRPPRRGEEVHVLLCVADHWEPKENGAPPEVSRARVRRWVEEYPRQFGRFRDSDGRTPRHTFFYPVEEYEPDYLDALAGLCRAGFGEVEIHLHHEGDTPENLRATLTAFKELLAGRHGLLSRRRGTGELAYGFIHGNWALCNARPDGRWCGVNEELRVLAETGCYADFTLPSAPSPTQTRKINSIYHAVDAPGRPKGHDWGVDLGAGPPPPGGLLLIQGPLVLDWRRRKFGLLPGVENACLQDSQPPDIGRLDQWLRARVQAPGRPDWFFVKLHAHGAAERHGEALLGGPMVRFHEALARRAAADPRFHYHYVTAREMYNLAQAAAAGWAGGVAGALDFELTPDAPQPAVEAGPKPPQTTAAL
jgi:hypothetical protein